MKKHIVLLISLLYAVTNGIRAQDPALTHPNTSEADWTDLFNADLSNGIYPKGVWSNKDGIMTATKDKALWSKKLYTNFIVDLEFKNAKGTNSGVFVHASSLKKWTENSVEIQIADDFDPEWANSPPDWQCGAIFGHQPASKQRNQRSLWHL